MNVGRVQTPTLKMLTDRDAAISHFQKEKYYHVRLCLIRCGSGKREDFRQGRSRRAERACEAGKGGMCFRHQREKRAQPRRSSFDLTSLQREANRIYGYTAKQTLDLAQALYEKRLFDLSEDGQQHF